MISYEDLPDDNADLKFVSAQFPYLHDNSGEACKLLMKDLREYLSDEAPEIPKENVKSLEFIRTAKVCEKDYWVWQTRDANGLECFVAIMRDRDGSTEMSYFANEYGLSVEQFLLGEYYGVL